MVFTFIGDFPFPTNREAQVAYNSLKVDVEPRKSKVTKQLEVNENVLHVELDAEEARTLRVVVNTFMDHLILVTETIDQFSLDKKEHT